MSEHSVLSIDPCLARSEIKAVGETRWEVVFFLLLSSILLRLTVLFEFDISSFSGWICQCFDH
jgi:hypothetical protein